jgi:hypothetical protein
MTPDPGHGETRVSGNTEKGIASPLSTGRENAEPVGADPTQRGCNPLLHIAPIPSLQPLHPPDPRTLPGEKP